MAVIDQGGALQRRLRRVMVEYNQMQGFSRDPLVIAEGRGIRMKDTEGRWYIDGLSGVFAVSVGHGNKEIVDAIARQHERIAFASPIMSLTEPALDLAERLCELSGGRAGAIKQYCAGSEATEAAIKIARQYHRQTGNPTRFKVISLYRGFHGLTMGAMAVTGNPLLQTPFHPLPPGVVHVHPPIARDWPGNPDEAACVEYCMTQLRQTIAGEGPETIAAVILEPLMLSAGGHPQPPGFMKAVRELCDEIGAMLIVDEIVTGFGRLGAWFACDLHDAWPDLMTVGKGLSGGYAPLSAVLMTEAIADSFWGDPAENRQYQSGHTFASNPVSAATGLAVLDYIERTNLLGAVQANGPVFGERLRQMAARQPLVRDIRGLGYLWVIDFAPGQASGEPAPEAALGSILHLLCRERGLLIRASRNVVQIAPPLTTTPEELEEIAGIVEAAIEELAQNVESGGAALDYSPIFSL